MKPFEYYLKENKVHKISKDIELAKALIIDMDNRIKENLREDVNKKPKTIFENIYDAIRDFCDSLLALEGYKSYSHEASITYLLKKGFDTATVYKLDNLRSKRNESKYYGKIITPRETEDIIAFYLQIKPKINKFIKENNLR